MCEFLQGNSTVKLDINSAVQTNPTASPVFGTMSVDIKSIFCSLRHYVVGLYGNNLLENDFVEEIAFPTITADAESDNFICNGLGGLLAHLRYPRIMQFVSAELGGGPVIQPFVPLRKKARLGGDVLWSLHNNPATGQEDVRTVYTTTNPFNGLNAVPILAYIDACLHYCVDPFDRIIPFESTQITESAGAIEIDRTLIGVEYDSLMNFIYESKGFSVPVNNFDGNSFAVMNLFVGSNTDDDGNVNLSLVPRYCPDFEIGTSIDALDAIAQLTFNDGLFPATFKPDLFTSWYDDEQVNKLTAVSFDNGNYTGLRLAQAEFNRLANNLIKGQTYEDYVDTTYGYNLKMCDHPILVGTDTYHIRFQDIVNTAARMGQGVQEVPLGTAVARGYASSSLKKTIHFTSQEPGYLLVLASLVPSVSYTEDVPAHLRFTKLGDTPNRFFDAAGFRNLKVGEAYFTATDLDEYSIGSQPFYYYNMLSYDRVSGLLATEGFNSYSFIRDFDVNSLVSNDALQEGFFVDAFRSKYINGTQFDYPFPANAPISVGETYQAISNATAQNYYFVFYFDLRVLEPLSNQVIARATF